MSRVQPLSVQQLHERLARGDAPVILDVREPWEVEICALPGSTFIPMGEIPANAERLPKDKDIVVLCHHGMRSFQVALYLQRLGLSKLYNLTGGIDAWAREIDSGLPTY